MAFSFPQFLFLTATATVLTFAVATSAHAEDSTTTSEEPTSETSTQEPEPARPEEDTAPEESSSETTTSEPEPESEEPPILNSPDPEQESEPEPAPAPEEEEIVFDGGSTPEEQEPEELPAPTVIETPGGDDSSYEIPINAPVIFYGVEYNKIYATTNAVFTFGQPDGTFHDYPQTPSISMASQDWTAYDHREDEHFIISYTDNAFQVDMSARPYGSDLTSSSTSRIVLAGLINEDRTLNFNYYTENVDQYENLRYGVRTPEGEILTLEEANFQESEEAPEESGEILPPEPEPEPTPEPEEEEVVEPEPEPEPIPEPPVISPEPEPTPPPSVVVPPQPSPEPTPEPTPEPEPEQPEKEAPEPTPEVEEETPADLEVDEEEQPEEQPEPEPTPEPTPDPEVSPSEPEPDESPEPTEEPVDDEPAPVVPDDSGPEPELTPEAEQQELVNNISQDNVIETVEQLQQLDDPKQITPEQQAVIKEAVNIIFQSSEPDSPEYEAALTALAVVAKADDPELDENIAAIPVLGSVAAAALETFNELGNIGADINPEVRKDAQEVVVASVIVTQVAQIATQAATVTNGVAPGFAAYRRFKK